MSPCKHVLTESCTNLISGWDYKIWHTGRSGCRCEAKAAFVGKYRNMGKICGRMHEERVFHNFAGRVGSDDCKIYEVCGSVWKGSTWELHCSKTEGKSWANER